MTVLYILITIIPWGTWIGLAQTIRFKNSHIKTFYVSLGNLILTLSVFLFQNQAFDVSKTFWLSFMGGVIWIVSAFFAFLATDNIGITMASGLWTPLNILVSTLWGIIIFKEFQSYSSNAVIYFIVSMILIICGILVIIFARGINKNTYDKRGLVLGFLGTAGAGVFWGSYFVPIKVAHTTMWIAALPLALGMFTGSIIFMIIGGSPPKLERKKDYGFALLSGILWGIGNYGTLFLVNSMGASKGFAIAQLSVVINASVGIFVFKDPAPRTKAAAITSIGILLALAGGIMLGS